MDYLKLQDGDSFEFKNGLIFRQPRVEDVKILGEQTYLWWMFTWVYTPQDLMHHLWKSGVDYEQVSKDDMFIATVLSNQETFLEIAKLFFVDTTFWIEYDQEYEMPLMFFNAIQDLSVRKITPYDVDEIGLLIKKIHNYKHKPKRKFASNGDKKKILEYELEEMEFDAKLNKDSLDFISSMKQALVVYNARTWEYVSKLTVYQLVAEFNGINRLEESKRVYQGLYAGTVDFNKIDKKSLNWID